MLDRRAGSASRHGRGVKGGGGRSESPRDLSHDYSMADARKGSRKAPINNRGNGPFNHAGKSFGGREREDVPRKKKRLPSRLRGS